MKVISIDIETIGNTNPLIAQLAQRLLEKKTSRFKDPNKISEYTEKYKDEFALSPLTGQIIAIGIAEYTENEKDFDFDDNVNESMRIISFDSKDVDEREMLVNFYNYINIHLNNSKIITYNGKKFDIPFIQIRSAVLGVPTATKIPNELYKTDGHIDLLNNFFGSGSLNDWAFLFGLSDIDRTTGADVAKLYLEGNWEEIINKCVEDALITLKLYLQVRKFI